MAVLPAAAVVAANEPPPAAVGADDRYDPWAGVWRDGNYTGTSLWDVRNMIQLGWGASERLTGRGVGIALIDTGIAPVSQIPASQVVNGPDLSFESQAPNLRYLDTYGHGTHMAGIILSSGSQDGHHGLARSAKVTSVKVGTATGAVDVSQVIAAVDWVVQNKNHDPAYPVRVINLSYGSGGTPSSLTDPLQFAVEQAWKAGIVVVAAAGNEATTLLSNPATDPYVLSVGSAKTAGTWTNADDRVSSFTNGKQAGRTFDVLAPGEGILSVRDPGSNIDNLYPGARVDSGIFRGSGTSQAAAVTSAVVALLLEARPGLTPDQVKAILRSSGTVLSGVDAGRRMLNVNRALATATPTTRQTAAPSTGTGTLEAARGANHVINNGRMLTGENSIFGPFDTAAWAKRAAIRTAWSGGVWMGRRMAGDNFTGTSWASKTWAPATWSGSTYSGGSWIDPSWSARTWSARTWSGGSWEARTWSSSSWYSKLGS